MVEWALAVIAAFCAFAAWDVNRVTKQTIANYLCMVEDLRKQLAAEQKYSLDMAQKNYDLTRQYYNKPANDPRKHVLVASFKAEEPKDYAVDMAKPGADHTASTMIQPDKEWPRGDK